MSNSETIFASAAISLYIDLSITMLKLYPEQFSRICSALDAISADVKSFVSSARSTSVWVRTRLQSNEYRGFRGIFLLISPG